MTVKELKAELNCYDEDMEIYLEFNDDIEVDSITQDKYGNVTVGVDKRLKHTFSGDINGYCWIEVGVADD